MAFGQLDYWLAFMSGILGSGHCIGMCGSLVCAFFMKMEKIEGNVVPYAAYHLSRITIYTFFGTLAALLGFALISTGLLGKAQGILQIIAGTIVILLGLDLLGWSPLRISAFKLPVNLFKTVFMKATQKGPVAGAAMGGVLNGFMPCALTLAIAVKATSAAQPWEGALLMLAFGLGTLPSMLFASVVIGKLGTKARGWLLKGAAVFVIILGINTLYQGARFFNVMKNLPNW